MDGELGPREPWWDHGKKPPRSYFPQWNTGWLFRSGQASEVDRYSIALSEAWGTLMNQEDWELWDERNFLLVVGGDNFTWVEDRPDFKLRRAIKRPGVSMYIPVDDLRNAPDLVQVWREMIQRFYTKLAETLETEPPPPLADWSR